MRKRGTSADGRAAASANRVAEAPESALLDRRKTVLIIADRDMESIPTILAANDLRLLGQVSPEEALERLERTVLIDLLLVQAPADGWSEGRRSLLLRLDQMARMGDAALVVVADRETVDMVFAAIESPLAQVLCDPTPMEIGSAVAMALIPSAGPMLVELSDINRESEAARLARLSEEVSRLARSLAASHGGTPLPNPADRGQVNDRAMSFSAEPALAMPQDDARPMPASTIRAMLRVRRMRDQMFPEGLFADPAWDMLLDLTAARLEGEKVSVSSLCIAAAVPPTTALRWIRNLTEQGIFQRQADYHDGRRVFITLSDTAFSAMNAFLRSAQRLGPILSEP